MTQPETCTVITTPNAVPIVYDSYGPSDAPTVVLCHGLAAGAIQFAADAAYFADRGFRVLVPDLRGHQRSGKPAEITAAAFSIATMAGDMVAMLDHAGAPRVHWVGNSLGGILALHMLAQCPQRFASFASFGTSYRLDLPRISAQAIPLLYRALGADRMASLTAWRTTRNRGVRPLVAGCIASFDPQVGRAIAQNVCRYDLIAHAAGWDGPILMLRGGRDGQVNAALGPTLKAMRGRPNFELVHIPEGGHCANLDEQEAFRLALRSFWARMP